MKEGVLDSSPGVDGVSESAGVLKPVPSSEPVVEADVPSIGGDSRSELSDLPFGMGIGSDIRRICCWNAQTSGPRPPKESDREENRWNLVTAMTKEK